MLPAAYSLAGSESCELCEHAYHGLPCQRSTMDKPCPCLGPWYGDRDAWLPVRQTAVHEVDRCFGPLREDTAA